MVRQSNPVDAPVAAPSPGEAARTRLLRAGLRLFAAQGFSKTSTREVAEAAGVNVASIAYYFGDKAGLYKAVFFEPLGPQNTDFNTLMQQPVPSVDDAVRQFYAGFLAPLKSGEEARLCIKLRFREILEPSGLWEQEVSEDIRPMHQHLVRLLCQALPVTEPDDDVHRLALCLSGLGVHLHVGGDIMDALAPQLVADAAAIDLWVDRLTVYALGMIDAERQRRTRLPRVAA
jgi:TetR/AcrR family transcriptional regulator, regulator of cefoperazone and chloramphenicol sensitivity